MNNSELDSSVSKKMKRFSHSKSQFFIKLSNDVIFLTLLMPNSLGLLIYCKTLLVKFNGLITV